MSIKRIVTAALATSFLMSAAPAMACKGEESAAKHGKGDKAQAKGQKDKQEKPQPSKET